MTAGSAGFPHVGLSETRDRSETRLVLVAVGCAALVVWALVAEIIAGANANSRVPAWADNVFSLAWPQPLRVLWWLAVAGAALGYRVALHRLGFRQRGFIVVVSVLPFVVFAAGVAAGTDWATWH